MSKKRPREVLKKTLVVLTYNVWFDALEQAARTAAIVDIAKKSQADFLCFQEATAQFVDALETDSFLSKHYEYSPFAGGWYGVITLVKKELEPTFEVTEFRTNMDRKLLTASTKKLLGGQLFTCGNVHLESLDSTRARREQLMVARKKLKSSHASVLCGDFNFGARCNWHDVRTLWFKKDADWEPYKDKPKDFKGPAGRVLENHVLAEVMPDYSDTWDVLHPADKGYTMDSNVNGMIGGNREKVRIDRVMLKKQDLVRASTIQLIGTEKILSRETKKPEFPKIDIKPGSIWPSDHFGLLARFDVGDAAEK